MVAVSAARGGLDGGDGSPVEGTSGIPLGSCEIRRAVMEAFQIGSARVDDVAAGEDIDLAINVLAIITTMMIVFCLFHGRHDCERPGLLLARTNRKKNRSWGGNVESGSDDAREA